jgi:hypothetical protein
MIRRLFWLGVILFCIYSRAFTQDMPLSIGQWKSQLPYNFGQAVTQSEDKIYYAANQSLVSIHKTDKTPQFYSRIDGMTEHDIIRLNFNEAQQLLVIGYRSGNMDILSASGFQNYPDIANNINITGDKTIYDFYVWEDRLLYISTGFGIIQFNLDTRFFEKTAFTPSAVLQFAIHDGFYYAATEDGLYRLSLNGFFQNFDSWNKVDATLGLPDNYACGGVVTLNDRLVTVVNDTLMRLDNGQREVLFHQPNGSIRYLSVSNGQLIAGYDRNGTTGKLYYLDQNGENGREITTCVGLTLGALVDQYDRVWYADIYQGFRSYDLSTQQCDIIEYNSPHKQTSAQIFLAGDSVYIAGGTIGRNFGYTNNNAGVYVNINGQWINYSFIQYPEMAQMEAHTDFSCVDVDLRDGTIYAGSYYGGVIQIKDGALTFFKQANSALQGAIGDSQRPRVAGMVRDRNNHLWIANSASPDPLVLYSAEGVWQNFRPVNSGSLMLFGLVDNQNNKWFSLGGSGVMVYHEGEDLMNPADDKVKIFNKDNGNLPNSKVTSLGIDRDGVVWVGTSDGVGLFRCFDVFGSDCRASRVVVQAEGGPEALLKDVEIRAIAVDGANRKWLGTGNGLFVQSADGLTEIAQFNTENSPLPSAQINTLAFNDETGEMWIGTELGVMVYQTDAPSGGEVHASEVLVYPNPVRPDYVGPIAIKGLPSGANVKITDIRGRLVYETSSLGSQAIWDGNDYTGRRVSSGVYLVFTAATANAFTGASDAAVSKIVFIR